MTITKIRTNLNAQGLCTYQLLCFLILWCSTWSEDSKDYKFGIFGCVEENIWIYLCNRWVWINLKMNFKLTTETIKYYCTIGFYSLLAFQRHKVCEFWMHGWKEMNFASFKQNMLLIPIWKPNETGAGHVVTSDSPVPIRLDRHFRLLDLIRSGRTRSSQTGWIKWSVRVTGSRSNGRGRREEERLLS
jgi:hypothetical protein